MNDCFGDACVVSIGPINNETIKWTGSLVINYYGEIMSNNQFHEKYPKEINLDVGLLCELKIGLQKH